MTQADQLAKALEIARASICADREALFRCHVDPATQTVKDEDGLLGLTEYDKVIEDIDEALAAHSAQASTTGAATTGAAVLPEQAVAWRLRIGDSDVWAYCETESAAIFVGKASGLRFVAEPLYASPPQVAVPQWLPIETAPKDGNPILVSTVNGLVRTARWSFHTKRWLIAWDANYSSTTERHATHWQSLPAAPIKEQTT